MNDRRHPSRFWLGAGLAAGALTGLYLWRRRRRLAALPEVAPHRGEADVALVTGASSGIGMRYALSLARRGYDVILVARREQRLRVLAQELERTYGVRAEVLAADLATPEGVACVEARIRAAERLDFLVNNAGFEAPGPFTEVELQRQHAMLALHALTPLRLMRAALPAMIARRRGAVVNVASLMAFYPLPGHALYGATKSYLVALSEALHSELFTVGVRVQALCPGFTRTEMHPDAPRKGLVALLWLSPEQVVARSLYDLERDRVVSVPGVGYRLLARLAGYLPRAVLYAAGRMVEAARRSSATSEGGAFSGFAKRTYRHLGEVWDDLRYLREHRGALRSAMALIDPPFRERLMLAVTQVNGCRYCAHYHAQLALKEGLDDEEVARLLAGSFDDAPPEERTALLYAQHWADRRGHPDPEARARLVEVYGAEKADAIDVLLHMIKMGNYLGNAWDYGLYRISGGRWGGVQTPGE
ncbi:MAG: SDR family NAD(P)-dependent oxidoreductase [Anaerolineae bacterium]